MANNLMGITFSNSGKDYRQRDLAIHQNFLLLFRLALGDNSSDLWHFVSDESFWQFHNFLRKCTFNI